MSNTENDSTGPTSATNAAAGTTAATVVATAPTMATGDNHHPYADRWHQPSTHQPELVVYNTFTRSKVPFRPAQGNSIRWYNCGPTVYDSSHIGHARNYVTFDIIRRILEDYFNYDVTLIMNITDIDDKIIIRARQAHLLEQHKRDHPEVTKTLVEELRASWKTFLREKLNISNETDWSTLVERQQALKPSEETDAKFIMNFNTALAAATALREAKEGLSSEDLLRAFQDILAPELDVKLGSTVTDQKIFRDLAAHWEREFLKDMRALNVRPVSLMTRVTEFVPQVIQCVQGILANGYAYESQGSVYFDVAAFHERKGHLYAKLCPWSAGNCKFFEEGEGALGVRLTGKKDPRDFALWKASKAGEPSWDSPWGPGRPGWHIECSAMAASVAPGVLDIHSGGIDLAFPHHDNELAQSEAYYENCQWVNYFLHAGHVHIEGHKMSKSLKNFITIRDALARYSWRQLRIMFLQHQWHASVYYKESSMTTAVAVEALFANFFSNISAHLRVIASGPSRTDEAPECVVAQAELGLLAALTSARDRVHVALCDNFDTPTALLLLQDLVNATNVYLKQQARPNAYVLRMVGQYVSKMLRIFGVLANAHDEAIGFDCEAMTTAASGGKSPNNLPASEDLASILEAVATYRDQVRATVLAGNQGKELLQRSDELRDQLATYGVLLEDRSGQATLVKLLDRETMARQRAEAQAREEERLARKLEMANINAAKAAAKQAKAAVIPEEMFRGDPALVRQYSQFDERGIPTHDAIGAELSKNARKKVIKEFEAQVELHKKYLDGKL